jgi:hypothetical protein
LRSFRPDGADAGDTDFTEALQLATSDRELGEWLMRERAFDAEFAEALARVDLPEGLRESVLLAMVQGTDFPVVDLAGEAKIIEAIRQIPVPVGLRERILEAMEQTAKVEKAEFGWKRYGIPMAAAAGIAMAFVLMRDEVPQPTVGNSGIVGVQAVQASFVRSYESPIFSLDETSRDQGEIIAYLRKNGLPCGGHNFPEGLRDVGGLGCRELKVDGKSGSLICFDEKDGTVHLVIFRRKDVEGDLPGMENPLIEESGNWSRASWANERYVYVMMSMREPEKLAQIF